MDKKRFTAGITKITATMNNDQEFLWHTVQDPKKTNWRDFVLTFADNNNAIFYFVLNDESEYTQDLEEFVDLLEGNGYTLIFEYDDNLNTGTVEVNPIHE